MTISVDALYYDLLEDLGLTQGDQQWFPWDSPSIVAKKVLATTFLKKFRDNADVASTDKVAIDKFLSVNEAVGTWQPKAENLTDEYLLGQFRYWCHKVFGGQGSLPLIRSFDHIFQCGRNGPKASVGTTHKDFYSKLFDSSLSATSVGLHRAYTAYISQFPSWVDAEQTRSRLRGTPIVVSGSKMSCVPKDITTSRTTCKEPLINMFCQLGIGSIIEEDVLKQHFKIDLSIQPSYNRALAQHYSLTGDGATIDLSSASDSISRRLVEWALPRDLVSWLDITRSPTCKVPGVGDVQLNMVSTMGNGFTFPLQTALFCCVVAASFDLDGLSRIDNPRDPRLISAPRSSWGVFGDDIIVPNRVIGKVRRLLGLLGFTVNSNKTFYEGPFRESCGVDAFNGVNVRGVYIKTLLEPHDRYTAINQLLAWSYEHNIMLPRVIKRLLRGVRRLAVPPWESESVGIRVPYEFLLRSRLVRRSKLGSILYKRWVPKQSFKQVDMVNGLIRVPGSRISNRFNPEGLYLTFLAGHLESFSIRSRPYVSTEEPGTVRDVCRIGVEPQRTYYSCKTGVAPNWEHHPTVRGPYKCLVGGDRERSRSLLIVLMSTW